MQCRIRMQLVYIADSTATWRLHIIHRRLRDSLPKLHSQYSCAARHFLCQFTTCSIYCIPQSSQAPLYAMSLAATCQVAFAPLALHPCSHPPIQEVVNAQRSGEYGTGFQSFLIVAEAVTGLMCLFVIWRTRGLKQRGGGELQLPRYAYFMACVQRNIIEHAFCYIPYTLPQVCVTHRILRLVLHPQEDHFGQRGNVSRRNSRTVAAITFIHLTCSSPQQLHEFFAFKQSSPGLHSAKFTQSSVSKLVFSVSLNRTRVCASSCLLQIFRVSPCFRHFVRVGQEHSATSTV